MIEPTSKYGCGDTTCVPCYGDKEWQMKMYQEWYSELSEEEQEEYEPDYEYMMEGDEDREIERRQRTEERYIGQ